MYKSSGHKFFKRHLEKLLEALQTRRNHRIPIFHSHQLSSGQCMLQSMHDYTVHGSEQIPIPHLWHRVASSELSSSIRTNDPHDLGKMAV